MNCPTCNNDIGQPPAGMTGDLNCKCRACGTTSWWVIDGIDWPDETGDLCDCGNARQMAGWRVCQACAQARLTYPHLFESEPPDKLEAVLL